MRYKFSLLSIAASALLLAGCEHEERPDNLELKVTDAQKETVLSLSEPNTYDMQLAYYQYLDIASPDLVNEKMPSPKFLITSNAKWRIEPSAGEEYDWIHPFPANGDKDGLFYFVVGRYTDQRDCRTAEFRIIVDDGTGERNVGGSIVITQDPSNEFLKKSAARLEFSQPASYKNLLVSSNVEWKCSLEPDSDYATEDLDWISFQRLDSEDGIVDTLRFTVTENTSSIRGARLLLKYAIDGNPMEEVFQIVQNGEAVDVEGFPIKWKIGVAENNYVETWPAEGLIHSIQGNGKIQYVSVDKSLIDVDKLYRLDINGNDPRVIGVWPGDYCQFVSDVPVSKGTILKISFEPRVSASCFKYWRLEYLDGNEWKIAGTPQITDEPGTNVVYTTAFNGGSNASANAQVSAVVKYENTTDRVDFRFICAANWTCNGSVLEAPNGASWRLTLTDRTSETWYPTIQCIAGGSEPMVKAQISVEGVENDLIVFEGDPQEPARFNVTSDYEFTVTADVDWLHITPASGIENQAAEIEVKCDASDLSVVRRAVIDIKSGVSHHYISVVQSAAGQDLKPFLSLVGGNSRTLKTQAGSFEVEIQGNVPFETECPEWVVEEEMPQTKGKVDFTAMKFNYAKNITGETRYGTVRFHNSEFGIETCLNLIQGVLEVQVNANDLYLFPGETSAKFKFESNVPLAFEVVEGEAVLSDSLLPSGQSELNVEYQGDSRAVIRVYNEENEYEALLTVNRYRVIADWLFTKAKVNDVKATWNSGGSELQGEGSGGKHVSDDVTGRSILEYYNGIDKSDAALSAKYKFSRATSTAGEPYVKSPMAGDYWLYTAEALREIPAGTLLRFKFYMRNSSAAVKYWLVEYQDGLDWKPVTEMRTGTAGTEEILYNFSIDQDSAYIPYEGTFVLTKSSSKLKIRVVAVANWSIKGAMFTALNNSTVRMGSNSDVTKNHIIEIVEK